MIRTFLSALVALVLLCSAAPMGGPSLNADSALESVPWWPGPDDWTYPSDCYWDPRGDESPASTDLVGKQSPVAPAAFHSFNDTAGYAYFRQRVDDDPLKKRSKDLHEFDQFAWVVLFDLPIEGDYEYLLSLNGNPKGFEEDQVQLWANSEAIPVEWSPILNDPADTRLWSGPVSVYGRSLPDGDGDFYVDWAIL